MWGVHVIRILCFDFWDHESLYQSLANISGSPVFASKRLGFAKDLPVPHGRGGCAADRQCHGRREPRAGATSKLATTTL